METKANPRRDPKWQLVLVEVLGLGLYSYLTIRLGGAEKNQGAIVIDTLLFYFWLVFWHFFFAQFVLPVQTLAERLMVFNRLMLYLFGRHGPAVLIENGDYRSRKKEMHLHKPGVALIDSASAAMLRTDDEYTRPVGPGVVFTSSNNSIYPGLEYFAGVLDLRPQSQVLGPKENEDPFAPPGEKEKEAAFEERKKRRYRTSGLTRNGIEVVPNVIVSFQLNTQPGLGGTQFGYNGYAVRLAITGEGIDPDLPMGDARRRIAWKDLPAFLAANVWREAIGMFTLDELFQDLPPDFILPGAASGTEQARQHAPTGIEFITAWVKARMTQEVINELDSTGRQTGARIFSPEFKILKERGIRVNNVSIANLRFQDTVEKELVQRWESTWYQRAMGERETLEQQLNATQEHGQESARHEYSQAIAQRLKKLAPGIEHTSDEILLELVESSLHTIVRDPHLQKRAANEKNALLDLIAWIQNNPPTP
jgi:hypothetical protein